MNTGAQELPRETRPGPHRVETKTLEAEKMQGCGGPSGLWGQSLPRPSSLIRGHCPPPQAPLCPVSAEQASRIAELQAEAILPLHPLVSLLPSEARDGTSLSNRTNPHPDRERFLPP